MTVLLLVISALMASWGIEVYRTSRDAGGRIASAAQALIFAAITIGAGIQLLFRG